MITFFAPTSFAICMISRDVVPRTIESATTIPERYTAACDHYIEIYGTHLPSTISTFLSTNSSAIAFNFFRTLFFLDKNNHCGVKTHAKTAIANDVPHLLFWHDEGTPHIPILNKPFAIRQTKCLSKVQRRNARGIWHRDHDVHRDS